MLKEYSPQHISYDYITVVSLPGFNFTVYYAEQLEQDVVVFPHSSDLYGFYYVLDGELELRLGDQIVRAPADTALLLSKNVEHSAVYHPQLPVSYFVLLFDVAPKSAQSSIQVKQEYQEIADVLSRIDRDRFLRVACQGAQRAAIGRIQDEFDQRRLGWTSTLGLLFYCLFIQVLRDIEPKRSGVDTPSGYRNIPLVVSKYIHANYMDKITIDMVAQRLNVTPRHINRLFQGMFGTSFAHSVNIIRTEYAKQYLLSTNDSIETIASRVGLPSGKVLTKLLKEREGMSPSAYRAAYQKKQSE